MINLRLERFCGADVGTFGKLVHSPSCWSSYTVERPWLDNKPFVSCIPAGVYPLLLTTFHRGKPKPYRTLEIGDVPGRTHIKIHRANLPTHVEGCVGLGKELGCSGGRWAVLRSTDAFVLFEQYIMGRVGGGNDGDKVGEIQIIGHQVREV